MINKIFDRYSYEFEWGYTERSVPLTFLNYQKWVSEHREGPLSYLTDHRADIREDIKNYFPEFESALVFLFPFDSSKKQLQKIYDDNRWNGLKLASYAFAFEGYDYHNTLRERLAAIASDLESEFTDLKTSFSLDIQPVLERDLAYRAGLGFFGKSSMFINESFGSNCIIGAVFLSQKLDIQENELIKNKCGSCSACISSCPTSAIGSDSTVDAAKCVCTYTVELFKDSPAPQGFTDGDYFFGCDVCQDICPWNVKRMKKVEGRPLSEMQQKIADFFLLRPLLEVVNELESMSNRSYRREFKGTSIERVGRLGMIKNIKNLRPDSF